MVCQGIDVMGTNLSFADYLVFPTTCFYHFYSVIFFGLFLLLVFILFQTERETNPKPDIVSIIGVSATAILFLAVIATSIKSTGGIPMLQRDILLYIVALWIAISSVWYFKD